VAEAQREANEIFAKLGKAVQDAAKEGVDEIDVLDIAHKAGLKELNEDILKELQVPRLIPCLWWLPWYIWWPWRPIWCWWWRWRYPWYGWCCPWWYHRCHWYPL